MDKRFSFRVSAAFFAFFHKLFFRSPSLVIFPSRFLKIFYSRWKFFPRSRTIVLPNPIPPHALGDLETVHALHEERLRTYMAGVRTFLYLGLIKKQKGIYVLLSAFGALASPQAFLLVAGTGQEEQRFRASARGDGRVTILGYLDRTAIRNAFTAAHFIVVPSLLYENSPMVVYESFAAGIPVIVSESGGASEQVSDGENGFIVPPGDERALLHAFERACRLDSKHYRRMCTSARASVESFRVEEYCAKILKQKNV